MKGEGMTGKSTDGYLTVMLSLMLSVMISLCLVLILGVRENTEKLELECITDIAMNNVLAEYHRELLAQYDLFFIDTSYGTSNASYEQTEAHLEHFIEKNLSNDDIFLSAWYRNPLKVELEDAEVTAVSVAFDEGGAVLRRQAVDVMYQRVGVSYLEQLESWVQTVETYQLEEQDVAAAQKEVTKALEEWDLSALPDSYSSSGVTVASYWDTFFLSFFANKNRVFSPKAIYPEEYLSSRQLLTGTGMNPSVTFEDGWWEKLIFQEYIMAYTGHYDAAKKGGALEYQAEYILFGKSSDFGNLESMIGRLLAIRAAANMVYLSTDTQKVESVKVVSSLLAGLLSLPPLEPVFRALILFTWAMAESIYDVTELLDGNKIPLIKAKADWHYSLDGLFHFNGSTEGTDNGKGLSYEDYLRIFLCFQDKETMTMRLMDVMEMDIRLTQGNRYFRMDGCIDSLTAYITYRSVGDEVYEIERTYGY